MIEKNPPSPLPESLFEGFLQQEQEDALATDAEELAKHAEHDGARTENVLSTGLNLMDIVRKKQK